MKRQIISYGVLAVLILGSMAADVVRRDVYPVVLYATAFASVGECIGSRKLSLGWALMVATALLYLCTYLGPFNLPLTKW